LDFRQTQKDRLRLLALPPCRREGGNFQEKNDLRLDFPEKEITLSD